MVNGSQVHVGIEREDLPLGTCEFCGDDYYDEGEESTHVNADCIGGDERFDCVEEARGEW